MKLPKGSCERADYPYSLDPFILDYLTNSFPYLSDF